MKVIAVTGGAQGIGRAIVETFAARGYAASFIDPAADAGGELIQHLASRGLRAIHEPGDVAVAAAVERWIDRTERELGTPDVLVNNTGISRNAPFLELAAADFERVLAVNLGGAFHASQAAARRMARRGEGGVIVNIASTRAFMSEPGTEAYTASKGAIVAFTHALAVSLGPEGIRVNCVSPGWIEVRDRQFSGRAEVPHHSDRDRAQHPVGRVGRPEDIAEACWFLAEHAGFMTGQNITIDGGMTVKMIYEE